MPARKSLRLLGQFTHWTAATDNLRNGERRVQQVVVRAVLGLVVNLTSTARQKSNSRNNNSSRSGFDKPLHITLKPLIARMLTAHEAYAEKQKIKHINTTKKNNVTHEYNNTPLTQKLLHDNTEQTYNGRKPQ